MLLNNNSLIMQWNRDENGNPISWHIPSETQQISPTHGVIQLVQVPDQHYRMKIVTENNIQLTEVFNIQDIAEDSYYVDYGVGIVRFHKSQHGKMVMVSYYGRGVILISDSRIFHRDGENVTDTWENILNRSQDALDLIESAGGLVEAMEKIDEKVSKGEATADRLENFITETQFYGYTINLSREAFVVKAKENGEVSKTELPTVYTDVVVYQGAKQIIPTLSIEQEQGCTFKIEGQRVRLATIDINVIKAGAILNIDCGDGLIAQRTLEVTKVFDGVSQYAVEMTNPFYSFEADSAGSIEKEVTVACDIKVTKANVDYTNYTISVQNAPIGLRYNIGATGVEFTGALGGSLPSHGSCLVVVTIDGTSFNKTFTWNKVRKGEDAKSLVLVGGQIIRYETPDYSDIPSPYRSTVTAKTVGLSGSPKWYVKINETWVLLEGQSGTELTFPHNDTTIWGNRKETTVKCSLEGYEDELTLVKLATGTTGADAITVVLTNESHTLAIDNSGQVHESEIAKTKTSVLAFQGTKEVTPVLSKGACEGCDISIDGNLVSLASLDNSFSTATAIINVKVGGVTVPKTWTISKAKQGSDGVSGEDGKSYILNITDGTRSFTYSQINLDPRPSTSSTFVGTLYENGVEVLEGVSYYWIANGHLQGSSMNSTFTPTISQTFDESILNNDITLTATYQGNTVVQTIPISITKDANGLDWVQEWDDTKTDVRGNLILTPKLFAGSYDQENDLVTGVAIGKDVLNDGNTIGVAGYQNNKTTFLLDTDGTLMVGNPFEENSTGLYFDGDQFTLKVNQLTIEGSNVATTDDLTTKVDAEINSAKEEIRAEVSDVLMQVDELDSFINSALKDGILDEVERSRIMTLYEALTSEMTDVASQYVSLINNPYLTNQALLETMEQNFIHYTECYQKLTDILNIIMGNSNDGTESDGTESGGTDEPEVITDIVLEETPNDEDTTVEDNLTAFGNAISDFKEASAMLHKSMSDALTSISEEQANTIVGQAKEEIKKEIDGVSDALGSLETTMNGEFKSGLISTMNLTTLRSKMSQLETEKADIDGQYKGIINHPKLGSVSRTNLANAKGGLDTAHDQLIAKIDAAIADNLMTEAELTEINLLIAQYGLALGKYSEVAQQCNADIALNLAQGAVEALNQEDIFNKLTNNGETQGIYLKDGKVYINGEYINSRNLKAVRNDGTETFKIDSEGNVHIRANSFYLVGDSTDSNVASKDYVDDAVGGISLGSINIMLSNEAQVIATSSSRVPFSNQTFSTKIEVYKGSTQIHDFTIGNISNANGITVSIDQNTKTVNFSVSSDAAIAKDNGSFMIPISVNGNTYSKRWTWAVSKQGDTGATGGDGQDAQYVILNGDQIFKYSNNFTGAPTPENIKIQATAYGISNPKYTWEFKRSGETTWNTITSATNSNQNYYTLPHDNSTIFNSSSVKSVTIRCTVNGYSDEITVVKVSDGAKGDSGNSAKNVSLTATSQVFKSTDGGKNFTPDSITIKPTYQNVSHSKWQHSLDGGKTWVDTGTNTNGVTIDGNGFTISKTSTLFTDKVTSIVVKDVTNDTSVTDTITITKLYDVTDLQIGSVNRLAKTNKSVTMSTNQTGTGYTVHDPYKTPSNKYLKDLGFKVGDKLTIGFNWSISQNGANDLRYGNARAELCGKTSSSDYAYIAAFQPIPFATFSSTNTSGRFESTLTVTEAMLNVNGFRIRIDNSVLNLTISKVKLEKGNKATDWSLAPEELENAYSIILTNEAQVIPTNSSRVPTSSTTYYTDVVVYQGTTQRTDYTIGTINSANGITVSKTSSRVNFAVSTETAITADGGNFTIPITIDGKTFNKTFSWSCSKQGNTGATGNAGQDAITIVLSNENHTFPCESNGNIPTALSTSCTVAAYKGATSVTPTIGSITNPTGMTISKNGVTLTIQANTGTSLADSGTVNIPITVDGKSFNKTFSWSKAKKGDIGNKGDGAKTADIIASSQVFKSTDGGLTFSPTTITMTPKLQNVTYSNWQYSTNGGSTWNGFSNSISGWSVSGGVLTVNKDCSLFTTKITSVVFRLNTNDSSVYDTITIVKLYDVADLEIGGRNYLKGTTNGVTITGTNTSNQCATLGSLSVNCSELDGKAYVLTAKYKVTSSGTPSGTIRLQAGGDLWGGIQSNTATLSASNKSGVLKASRTLNLNGKTFSQVQVRCDNLNETIKIYDVKYELGNKPTDWTPAPEDLEDYADQSAQNAVNAQTQASIFNKLTNNGQTQGIYLENSKIYINGEYIKANSITADRLSISDFTNYAQLNNNTATKYGFTKQADEASGAWFKRTAGMGRDIAISEWHTCNGGESLRVKFDMSTSIKGNSTSGGTDSSYRGSTIMIFAADGTGKVLSYIQSLRYTNTTVNGASTTITLPSGARKFRVYLQTDSYGNWSGEIKIRNVQVTKMASGELIVDGSITATKIASRTITADKIQAGAITANEIKAGAITANMITSGTFSGVNFFAGGRGSSGLIKVLDSNNNVSFSASSAGITATLISFESSINSGGTAVRGNKYARMNSEGTVATTVVSNSALSSSSSAFTTGSGFEIVEEITQNNGGTYTNYEERVSLTTSGLYLGSYGSIGGTMTSALRLQKFANQYALRIEGTDSFANGGFGIYRSQTNVFNVSSSGVVKIGNGVQLSTSSDGNRLKIQTSYGNVTIGSYNSDWCHFSTDRPKFWFEKQVSVQGEIYAGSGYNQRVFHQGWTPRSGNWWSGGAVTVGTDGVAEVGKYIDFHNSNSSTSDYDMRLSVENDGGMRCTGSIRADGGFDCNGGYWINGYRCVARAGHGGFDFGHTGANTALLSANAPTWWNGSTSYKIYTEGNKPTTADIGALGAKSANGYWGMASPDGADNTWIRATTSGIIPYKSSNSNWVGDNSSLGTTGWRFTNGFIKEMYCNGLKNDLGDLWLSSKPNDSNATIYIQTKWLCPSSSTYTYLGSSGYRWHSVWASNGSIQTSDERFKVKQGFTDIEECYEMIKYTDIYNYIMLNQNKEDLSKNRLGKLALSNSQEQVNVHMGIMAQDIQKYKCSKQILVEGEYERADGSTDTMLSVNPYGLTTAVMGALKVEIQKRELLEEKITKLESLVEQLMAQLVK